MIRPPILALLAAAGLAGGASADSTLPLPASAEQTARLVTPYATYALPVGPWENGKTPAISLSGALTEEAWRIPGNGEDTLKLSESLRAGLVAEGYAAIFACATDACGGFDFRYETDFLPEPEMHVDLSDFRYLSAVRGQGAKAEYLGLMVSRAGGTGFVQLTRIGAIDTPANPPPPTAPAEPVEPEPAAAPSTGDFASRIEGEGRVVLTGLRFASGAADLAEEDPASLTPLADYLARTPAARVLIVGHTDASGSLAGNITLSQGRAQAVVNRLVTAYGVDPSRLSAEGAGPLAPLATNLTPEGREKNRRVEAVLASTR